LDNLFIYPEYNQEEKIYQYLLKLKNKTNKKLIIQTYFKNTEIFKNFKENKIKETYNKNLKIQKQLNYPPFSQLTKLSLKNKNKTKTEVEAFNAYKKLQNLISKNNLQNIIEISKPYPILNEKENDFYIYNILIKTILAKEYLIKTSDLKKRNFLLNKLDKNWKIDIDPISTI
jgi:primosomal protein N' (replication factor Y) (superfamily II helicase)